MLTAINGIKLRSSAGFRKVSMEVAIATISYPFIPCLSLSIRMVTPESWISVWIDRFLSCLGSTKCAPAISGNNLNSRMPSMSEDFWSTSTCDLDELITLQSRQSSFISIINHNPKHGGGTDDLSNHSDFVNNGLILWTQTRLQWIGNYEPAKRTKKNHFTGLSWYMTKELLLENKKPFPRPIPLSEMVDFLIEEWEEEGLYY